MLSEQSGIQVDKFYPPTDWQYSFPEGYTRLEYLESTGTQWIDTGLTANQDTIIKCRVSNVNSGTQSFMGLIEDSKIYGVGQQVSNNYLYGQYYQTTTGNRIVSNITGNDGIIRNFELRKNNFYINNTLIGSASSHTFTSTNTIKLFTHQPDGSISSIKIYSAQIYDDTTLVRNFIPAKRNSDNKPGMYDLVNNVFYVNQGSGDDFVMGPALYQNKSQIDIRQKNNLNFGKNYEFNSNDELTWANPNLYLTGKVNYTKVGNPTIVDNVASGFSSSNYINAAKVSGNVNSVELVVKVGNLPSTPTNSNELIIGLNGTNMVRVYYTSANKIQTNFKDENNTTRYINMSGTFVGPYYKLILNSNGGYAYSSSDGINWTLLSNSLYKPILNNMFDNIRLGYVTSTYNYFEGSIDLSQTYVKVNNELWFYGKINSTSNIAPVPAGFAYNNTTTPSVGYVNTQTQTFTPAPEGAVWKHQRDISVVPPEDNTITLLYGVASDFSAYSLFGLLAQVSSGTYDVYIDDVLFATTASGTQTDIDFSQLGSEYVSIGTATTPESLVLHKIVIKPTTSGERITQFKPIRTTGISTAQQQGVLWIDFNLDNFININNMFRYDTYIIIAITAKNDTINTNVNYGIFQNANTLKFLPKIIGNKSTVSFGYSFRGTALKRLIIKDMTSSDCDSSFRGMPNIEQINTNINTLRTNTLATFENDYKLKTVPYYDKNSYLAGNKFTYVLNQNTSLYPTKFDLSNKPNIPKIILCGSSTYPMRGLRGLKVSNEAPFNGTSPQINVAYTGLGRNELIELFNSMPDVTQATDGITRTINITAASGNNLTKIGSPTIDSNGVASGFSTSNYLSMPTFTDIGENLEICICIIANANKNRAFLGVSNTYSNERPYFNISSSKIGFKIRKDLSIQSNYTISLNTYYKAILKRINNIYTLLIYDINNNLLNSVMIESSDLIGNGVSQNFIFGADKSTYGAAFDGSIDLENTYIKVGQDYLMKGYLLDSDRLIVTNKGWTITG